MRSPPPAPLAACRRAFTLIELMIAVALGMLVVYTAVAGFRVASQSVSMANRLSLENALIRAGFQEAHHQLDFWTNLDDPEDASRQRLRGRVAADAGSRVGRKLSDLGMATTVGLPFTPLAGTTGVFLANTALKAGMSTSGSAVPRFANPLGTPQAPLLPLDGSASTPAQWNTKADNDIGFDPSYAWAPHDPRTWYRGNCIEKNRGDHNDDQERWLPPLWFGRYGMFANTDQGGQLSFRSYEVKADRHDADAARYTASFAPDLVPHRWYARQLAGLGQALGFYGMCDYLPSNTIFTTYTSYSGGRTSSGGIPNYFLPDQDFFIGQGMHKVPGLGLYSLTVTQSYGISNPVQRTASDADLVGEHYRYWDSDYSTYWDTANAVKLQDFMTITLGLDRLMTRSPEHWPVVSVGVAHYIKSAKFANVARVRWTSPLTGNQAELSFTGVGTTLRGARMQRKPGGGWARWDNLDGGAGNDPNLDTP